MILTQYLLLNKCWYFLTGLQVLSNPQIAVCEQMEGINNTGEFTTERNQSGMMANNTSGGGNETCITCGKTGLSVSM